MAFVTDFLASDGDGVDPQPVYTAEQLRLIHKFYTEGVLEGFEVSERGAGANTTVDVTAGVGLVEGPASFGALSRYLVEEDSGGNTGAVGSAPGSNFRNDIVGIIVNDPDAPGSSDTLREAEYHVVTGAGHTPATLAGSALGAAGDPSLPDRFLPLARVRWSVGMVSITDAQIDDLRSFATLAWDVVDDANATRLGTSAATAGAVMRRDASGRVAVANPSASGDAANRGWVISMGTTAANNNSFVLRDGSGRAQISNPNVAADIANKDYVDTKIDAPTTGSLDGGKVQYARMGSIVHIWTVNAATAGAPFATLPAGFRPAIEIRCAAVNTSDSQVGIIVVTTGGDLTLLNAAGSAPKAGYFSVSFSTV